MSLRIGVVGLGQIARGRHLPAIAGSADFIGQREHIPAFED